MSNLNLPNMSYDRITGPSFRERLPRSGKIAYATHVKYEISDGELRAKVLHHGNLIAVISPENIEISNCGYNSPTTANRLNTVVVDNRAGNVGIKNGMMEYFNAWTRGPRGGLKRHNPISVGSYFLKIDRNSVTYPLPEV